MATPKSWDNTALADMFYGQRAFNYNAYDLHKRAEELVARQGRLDNERTLHEWARDGKCEWHKFGRIETNVWVGDIMFTEPTSRFPSTELMAKIALAIQAGRNLQPHHGLCPCYRCKESRRIEGG